MTQTVRYYGGWKANSSSSYGYQYGFTNLREAKRLMRTMAEGNTTIGNTGSWQVTDAKTNEIVAQGTVKY